MADQIDQHVAANVKRLREQAGLKQAALVDLLRVNGLADWHPTTLSRTESGERPLRMSEAVVLARVLGVDLATLVEMDTFARVVRDAQQSIRDVEQSNSALAEYVKEAMNARVVAETAMSEAEAVGEESDKPMKVRARLGMLRKSYAEATELSPSEVAAKVEQAITERWRQMERLADEEREHGLDI